MRIVFILLFTCFAMTGKAQTRFGVKGGINIANQVNPFIYTYNSTIRYDRGQAYVCMNGAFFMHADLFDKVMLRLQIGFGGQGYRLPEVRDALGVLKTPPRKFRLNYFLLPAQIIYPVKLNFGTIWVGAGPYIGYLFSGSIKTSSSRQEISIGNDGAKEFRTLDFGISPSLVLKFKNGFLVGVDDNIGIADVSGAPGKNRNTSWSFYIGYLFK